MKLLVLLVGILVFIILGGASEWGSVNALPTEWNMFGGNPLRTRVVDDRGPEIIAINVSTELKLGQSFSIRTLWKDVFSTLSLGVIEENINGDYVNHTVVLKGVSDWMNYTLTPEKKGWFKVRLYAFDVYGNGGASQEYTISVMQCIVDSDCSSNEKCENGLCVSTGSGSQPAEGSGSSESSRGDGGGGGGPALGTGSVGGGLSSAGAGTEKRYTKLFAYVMDGVQERVSPNKSEISVMELNFTLSETRKGVVVKVEKLDEKPAHLGEPSGRVYQYLDISISEAVVDKVTVTFKVDKDWLASNDLNHSTVRLNHYKGDGEEKWVSLNTTLVEEGDVMEYRAESEGFSYFAITAEKNQEEVKEAEKETVVNETVGVAQPENVSDNETEDNLPEEKKGIALWMFIPVFVILAVIFIIITSSREEEYYDYYEYGKRPYYYDEYRRRGYYDRREEDYGYYRDRGYGDQGYEGED